MLKLVFSLICVWLLSSTYCNVSGELSGIDDILDASWSLSDGETVEDKKFFVAAIVDDNLYTFGGFKDTFGIPIIEKLDISAGSKKNNKKKDNNFVYESYMPYTVYPEGHFIGANKGMRYPNDTTGVYLACEDNADSAKITRYDIETKELLTLIELPYKVEDCCAVMYDSEIFIIGGSELDIENNITFIYDIETDTYRYGADLLYTRQDHTCIVTEYSDGYNNNNPLISIWGRSRADDDFTLDKYVNGQYYDIVNDMWIEIESNIPNYISILLHPRVIWIENTKYVLFTGGENNMVTATIGNQSIAIREYSSKNYLFDLETFSFIDDVYVNYNLPSFNIGRSAHGLVAKYTSVKNKKNENLQEMCIYAIGGYDRYDIERNIGLNTKTYETLCFEIDEN